MYCYDILATNLKTINDKYLVNDNSTCGQKKDQSRHFENNLKLIVVLLLVEYLASSLF